MRRVTRAVLIGGALAVAGCARPHQPMPVRTSVRPGINERFLDPGLDVDRFAERWEGESREIYRSRHAIVGLLDLRPGMRLADIGAGTGLFEPPFAQQVGLYGTVFAVDIAPAFVRRIQHRAETEGLPQVRAVLCTQDSVNLADRSIDVAFCCDTYHHFEYPQATLASIHRALQPGGRFVVIDFKRIPGRSRAWILNHVRCGKTQVITEIEQAGFRLIDEPALPDMSENYILRFARE